MTWRRRRAQWAARWAVATGPGLALLLAVAVIGAVDAARGQTPATDPPAGQDPPPSEPLPACSNLEDDDDDGLTDLDDPGCSEPMDVEELDPASPSPPSPSPSPLPTSDPPSAPSPPPTGGAGEGVAGSAGGGTTRPGGNAGGGGGAKHGGPGRAGGHGGHRAAAGGGGTPAASHRLRNRVPQPSDRGASGGTRTNPTRKAADSGLVPIGVPGFLADRSTIPSFLLPLYRECGSRYGLRWQVLAAINEVETGFGANLNVSTAGAVGWMQFLPSTWSAYGVDADGDGSRDPYDPHDAICAAARYLRAAGAPGDMRGAVFAYNHAEWYVDLVLDLARQYESLYLPEPLPRARRLDRDFAGKLVRIARGHEVGWAQVLAILRVRGDTAGIPASAGEVRAVAERVVRAQRQARGETLGAVVRSLFAKRSAELKVAAATRYNRALGLRGLVAGMHAVEDRLRRRVLESDRLLLYPGGRNDIDAGRIDPRVLTLLLYLTEKYDEVTITSLVSGHGIFARPGVPSMHVFGRAVDIAAIRGRPLLGHQQPGGIAEDALRDILLLPDELQPAQVISLIDLGGPSFAASDHDDHIHVGF